MENPEKDPNIELRENDTNTDVVEESKNIEEPERQIMPEDSVENTIDALSEFTTEPNRCKARLRVKLKSGELDARDLTFKLALMLKHEKQTKKRPYMILINSILKNKNRESVSKNVAESRIKNKIREDKERARNPFDEYTSRDDFR